MSACLPVSVVVVGVAVGIGHLPLRAVGAENAQPRTGGRFGDGGMA